MNRTVILSTPEGEELEVGTVGDVLHVLGADAAEGNEAAHQVSLFVARVVDELAFGEDYDDFERADISVELR